MTRSAVSLLVLLLISAGLPVAAQPVRWVIIEVSGTAEPNIATPHEVVPGTSVKLGRGSSLMFSDYTYHCRTLIVADGTVTFAKQGWEISSGGRIAEEGKFRCPRRYALRDARRQQTLFIGPDRGRSEISTRPTFLFTGPLADTVVSVQLDGEISATPLRFHGRRAWLADDAADLLPGSAFRLIVRLSDPGLEFLPLVLHVRRSALAPMDRVTLIELDEYKPG